MTEGDRPMHWSDVAEETVPAIVVCPGFHAPDLTHDFLAAVMTLPLQADWLVVPSDRHAPYDGWAIADWLRTQPQLRSPQMAPPLILIGFSAGVVGAMGTAIAWTGRGGKVRAVFAWDGWGVPAGGDFPLHRLSHDAWTHWTSALLGAGQTSFYADPGVAHLELWRSPQQVAGWAVTPAATYPCTALEFFHHGLQGYCGDRIRQTDG